MSFLRPVLRHTRSIFCQKWRSKSAEAYMIAAKISRLCSNRNCMLGLNPTKKRSPSPAHSKPTCVNERSFSSLGAECLSSRDTEHLRLSTVSSFASLWCLRWCSRAHEIAWLLWRQQKICGLAGNFSWANNLNANLLRTLSLSYLFRCGQVGATKMPGSSDKRSYFWRTLRPCWRKLKKKWFRVNFAAARHQPDAACGWLRKLGLTRCCFAAARVLTIRWTWCLNVETHEKATHAQLLCTYFRLIAGLQRWLNEFARDATPRQ